MLTDIVGKLAAFFGFELPKIDYSKVGSLGAEVENLATGLDDANTAAEKLRGSLASFDEINLLQEQTSSDKAEKGGVGGRVDLGIDLSQFDYDFLTEVEDRGKEIAEKLSGVFKGILAAVGLLALVKIVSWIVGTVGGIFGKGAGKAATGSLIPSPKQILIALTDLALIVSGLTLLLGTIGLLMKIPGFENIVKTGIKVVGDVFKGLWDIAIPSLE